MPSLAVTSVSSGSDVSASEGGRGSVGLSSEETESDSVLNPSRFRHAQKDNAKEIESRMEKIFLRLFIFIVPFERDAELTYAPISILFVSANCRYVEYL